MEGESVVATSWYLLQSEYTYQPAAAVSYYYIFMGLRHQIYKNQIYFEYT